MKLYMSLSRQSQYIKQRRAVTYQSPKVVRAMGSTSLIGEGDVPKVEKGVYGRVQG